MCECFFCAGYPERVSSECTSPHLHFNRKSLNDRLVHLKIPDSARRCPFFFSLAVQLCLIRSRPYNFALRKLARVLPLQSQRSSVDRILPLFDLAFETLCLQVCRKCAAANPANGTFPASSSRSPLGRSEIRSHLSWRVSTLDGAPMVLRLRSLWFTTRLHVYGDRIFFCLCEIRAYFSMVSSTVLSGSMLLRSEALRCDPA